MAMSIATCMAAQIALETIQDILFGTPMPHESYADLGILAPEYVNIAVDGHEPFVGMALIKLAEKDEIQEIALMMWQRITASYKRYRREQKVGGQTLMVLIPDRTKWVELSYFFPAFLTCLLTC